MVLVDQCSQPHPVRYCFICWCVNVKGNNSLATSLASLLTFLVYRDLERAL